MRPFCLFYSFLNRIRFSFSIYACKTLDIKELSRCIQEQETFALSKTYKDFTADFTALSPRIL